MSISRALTSSRRKLGLDTDLAPSFMKRNHAPKMPDSRPKISGPLQLIHTTNILTYNAPDLPRTSPTDTSPSKTASFDSETFLSLDSTPPTSPDVSARRSSASPSPEPNHLSCYFQPAGQPTTPDPSAPVIPARSPSHTKKASYDALVRKRSNSRHSRDSDMSISSRPGLTYSRNSSTSTHPSPPLQSSTKFVEKAFSPSASPGPLYSAKESNPFGQELAQVTELAQEFNARKGLNPIDEEEDHYLATRGLAKFSADDYLGIVEGVTSSLSPQLDTPPAPLWI